MQTHLVPEMLGLELGPHGFGWQGSIRSVGFRVPGREKEIGCGQCDQIGQFLKF